MTERRRDGRTKFLMLGGFIAVFLFTLLALGSRNIEKDVGAASLAEFDPGYIISDYQMGRYDAMSEAEIQAFLTSKNSCANTNYAYYLALSANKNYTWHFENGHFVCLSEELFGDGEVIGSGETAAHIIWQAAQDYKINPQVLIVLLQKETGLITDPIPNDGDYRKATGYGCPDTAPCSSQYYGFKNQIRKAAALFRTVLDGGWTNYPLGENYVQYNPSSSCGGSMVNIRSLATSALYRYTPYQPNASALAAGYGYGDGCSAYGNRNFYLYFEDWFGGVKSEGNKNTVGDVMKSISNLGENDSDLDLEYNAHIQKIGWINNIEGEVAGSVGLSLRLEAFSMRLTKLSGIEYRSYVEGSGWEESYKKDGEISGTTGKSLMLEAVQIRLNEGLSEGYEVQYRVHVAKKGWTDWVKEGEVAGFPGEGFRIEAIQVKFLAKKYEVNYLSHVQSIGWMDWVKNGELAGTTGQSLRMEAIEIKLNEELAKKYDILYRVHVQSIGWMDWVKNGELAGTTGQGFRLEAIEIAMSERKR